MKRNLLLGAVVAALGAVSAGNASAYATFYGEDGNGDDMQLPGTPLSDTARQEFFAAGLTLGGSATPAIENFESRPAANANGELTLSFGAGTSRSVEATLRGGSGSLATEPAGGRYSVPGGSAFWLANATSTADTFEVDFDNPVVQFGFYGIDIGDFEGSVVLDLLDQAGNVQRRIDSDIKGTLDVGLLNGSVRYVGVLAGSISEAFWGVRFRTVLAPGAVSTGPTSDLFAFDSFTVVGADRGSPATPISAPGTLSLLGTALIGLALLRRRA